MNIAIMGTRGIPANYGGFETFAEELGSLLASRGHRVTVYGRSHYATMPERAYKGVRLVVLPSLRTKHLDTVVHSFLSAVHGLFQSYDAVIMCNAANSFACLLPRLAGQAVVINVDGLEWQRRKWGAAGKAWHLLGERLACRLADAVVADARVIQEYYRSRYGRDSAYIPYGAPAEKVPGDDVLRRFNLAPDGYFLYVSRLEPENNAHVVIEAYKRVATDLPLVLVGDAPYSRRYISRLKEDADRRVVFTGFVFGDGYRRLQSNCFAYIQATEVGGTHPALIEGLGMANAVIANDTPENREAAADGALFYRRNDPASLAEIMQNLLAEPKRRLELRNRAVAIVRREYDWRLIADRYEALLKSLRPSS